jgi:hypothetical protein
MTGALIEEAGGTIAQVSNQKLTAKVEMFLNTVRIFRVDDTFLTKFFKTGELFVDDERQGVFVRRPSTEHVGLAERHVHLLTTDPDAILAAVVLFLHEQEQFLKPIECPAVFVMEVVQRLQKPNER